MALSEWVREILVCPESKEPLIYFEEEQFLFCPASKLKYSAKDDIPVMLIEEAERLDDAQCAELLEKARKLGLALPDEPAASDN